MSLHRAPPRPRGWRSRGLIWSNRRLRAGRAAVAGMQKPLAAGQGKTVPGSVSAGCCGAKCTLRAAAAPGGGNPGSGWRRRAAPDPGLHRRRSGVGAGFEPEGGHLVLLVTDGQHEVMQGVAKDSVGAVIEWLKWRYVAVPPHDHRRCAGKVVWQLRRRSAALSVLENCSRKSFEGNSG
jgi:hypothetical protein